MLRTVMLVALLAAASLLLASVPTASPPGAQDNPWLHTPSPTTPVDDGTQTGTVIPFVADEVDYGMISGRPGQGRSPDDHRITGEFGANVDYSTDLGAGGGYIAYREYAAADIWFDGWNFTGIEKGRAARPGNPKLNTATVFARSAVLNLSLPVSARVNAKLYDDTGRMAAAVFNGRLEAGEHRLPIAAGTLSPGIYFLNLDIDGRIQAVKLVHLR